MPKNNKVGLWQLSTFVVIAVATLLTLSPTTTKADTTQIPNTLSVTECFDYYNFGSITVNLNSQVDKTVSGATLDLKGTIENKNNYPVVDGALYVKVFKKDTSTEKNPNGPAVVDQFFVKDNINLSANGKLPIEFTWKIPAYTTTGNYRIATYFVSAKKFNLLGLSFTNDIIGNTFDFSIKGENPTLTYLDKETVTVNGSPFYFAAFPPQVSKGDVTVKANLVNKTDKTAYIPLYWKVYSWDGLQDSNIIDTNNEIVEVKAGQTRPVTLTIKDATHSVYYITVEANDRDAKSILDIRFVRPDVDQIRINFPAVTTFPLTKGEPTTLFSCLHSVTSDIVSDSTLLLSLKDANGREIYKSMYQGDVTGDMMGVKEDFTPQGTYDKFTLSAKLFDSNGLVDSADMVYDCNQIDKSFCNSTSTTTIVTIIIIIILLGLLIWWRKSKTTPNIPTTPTIMLLLLATLMSIATLLPMHKVEAKDLIWNLQGLPRIWSYTYEYC